MYLRTYTAEEVKERQQMLKKNPIAGLADSKKLSEKKRLALAAEIKEKALAYG